MKKITYKHIGRKCKAVLASALVLTAVAGSVSSCSDTLDPDLYSIYTDENYFETLGRAEMAVKGIYKPLANKRTYGQMWMVAESATDNYQIKGSLGHVARDVGQYNMNPNNSWVEEAWRLCYESINKANSVIENIHKAELKEEGDEKKRERMLAEAYAMRAFVHFDLVKWWGGIPLRLDKGTTLTPVEQVRNTRDEVYERIILDFEKALELDIDWAKGSTQGRINRGAVMGLLAKAYLYRGGYGLTPEGNMERPSNYKDYYKKAAEILDQLITSGKHGLEPSYEGLFKDYYCSTGEYKPYESMFEIDFLAIQGENDNLNGVWGTYNGPSVAVDVPVGRANAFMTTFGHFYESYDPLDLRRDVAIDPNKYTWDKATLQIVVKPQNRKNSYLWAPGKWRRVWHTMPKVDNNNTDVNYPVLRFADVLLMYAEAANVANGGPTTLAVERFNQVRRRGFGKPIETPDPAVDMTFADEQQFFDAIFIERDKELCFEGHRRQDLIRWNLLAETIKATDTKLKDEVDAGIIASKVTYHAGNTFEKGKDELFPIPAREIRETKGSLTQNPGYAN